MKSTQQRLPIFYYHSVGGKPPQTLAVWKFRRHLELIRELGFSTVTVAESLIRPVSLEPACVLVFDDGLLDNFTVVLPLLQEFGFRATFYVVPGYDEVTRWVNPSNGRWSDIQRPQFSIPFQSMGAEHRRQLHKVGMEIGCHTWTHRKLTKISDQELEREIRGSKDHLEHELEAPVDTFCYPNGRFNLKIRKLVRQAGYLGACSTIPGYRSACNDRFVLPRFLVEDPECFEAILKGQAFWPSTWLPRLWQRFR